MTGEEHHRQRPGAEIADSAPERKRDERRLVRRPPDDHRAPAGDHRAPAGDEQVRRARGAGPADQQPDVLLDVPVVKVDEINLEVEDLQARISLQAQVLDLLKLHVGADVSLGRVSIGIKGVEAAALLKVRLDNVAAILDRVMTTLDQNPQVLGELSRGLGKAVSEIGRGSGEALEEVGEGAGGAVEQVGEGAGGAVEQVGEGAGGAVERVGEGTGEAVEQVGEGTGSAAESIGGNVGQAAGEAGRSAGRGVEDVSQDAGDVVEDVSGTAGDGGDRRRAGDDRRAERPQRPRRRMPPGRRGLVPMSRRPDGPDADITLAAEVSAEMLRFGEVPQTHVEFTGAPRHDSASGSDRFNLPERVKASVTYRDVKVDYRLAAKLIYESGSDATRQDRADPAPVGRPGG